MEDKSVDSEVKRTKVKGPNWSKWRKMTAWKISDAVALSLNIVPANLDKLKEKNTKKYSVYCARLDVVMGQKPETFVIFENLLGDVQTNNSRLVSPQSFVSFAIDKAFWKNLPEEFINIGQSNDTPTADAITKIPRKATDNFIAALIIILVEIGNREGRNGRSFDVSKMPGTKLDFYNLARRYDPTNIGYLAFDTFDSYIRPFCKFKSGSRASKFYNELFPDFPPKISSLTDNDQVKFASINVPK